MKTRTGSLILIAMLVSFFLAVMPLHAAENSPGCPFNKVKKCEKMTSTGAMGPGVGCQGMKHCQQWRQCGNCWEGLTSEDIEKVKKERTAFAESTRDLRQELKSKNLALKSELVKKEPNAESAMALQDEISKLSSQLDNERLKHILAVKKIAPYATMKCLKGGKGGMGGCKMSGKKSPFCQK